MREQLNLLVQFEHRVTSPSIYLIPQLCHLPTPRHLGILLRAAIPHPPIVYPSIHRLALLRPAIPLPSPLMIWMIARRYQY